jgi:hypothetical protein
MSSSDSTRAMVAAQSLGVRLATGGQSNAQPELLDPLGEGELVVGEKRADDRLAGAGRLSRRSCATVHHDRGPPREHLIVRRIADGQRARRELRPRGMAEAPVVRDHHVHVFRPEQRADDAVDGLRVRPDEVPEQHRGVGRVGVGGRPLDPLADIEGLARAHEIQAGASDAALVGLVRDEPDLPYGPGDSLRQI